MYLTWSLSVRCRLRPSPFHLCLFDFQRSSSWIVRSALDWRHWPLKTERILKRLYNVWWEESDFKARLHFVLPFHWNLTWSWKMAVLRDQETRRSSEGTSLVLKSDWWEWQKKRSGLSKHLDLLYSQIPHPETSLPAKFVVLCGPHLGMLGSSRKVRGGINPAERGAPLGGPGSWWYLNQSWYAIRPNRATSISGALKRSRQHRAAGTELHCRHHAQFIFYSLLLPLWLKSTPPLRYAICHWHVFQMCFSLARRVEITGGQGKQTVVLLYRLHRGFVESEWTQAKVSQSTDTYLNMCLHKKTTIPREKQRVLQSLDSSQPVLEMPSN